LKAEGVLPAQTLVRTNKYLNNLIEQDHRKAPQRCYPMLEFKTFKIAEVTLSGIELANKIKKGQFNTPEITGAGAMILQVWGQCLSQKEKSNWAQSAFSRKIASEPFRVPNTALRIELGRSNNRPCATGSLFVCGDFSAYQTQLESYFTKCSADWKASQKM